MNDGELLEAAALAAGIELDSGMVRLEAFVTLAQREKFRQIGGDNWLRKAINRAKAPKGSE